LSTVTTQIPARMDRLPWSAPPGGEFFPQAAAGVYDRGRARYPPELVAAFGLPAGGSCSTSAPAPDC
jgi:hypothetical protein